MENLGEAEGKKGKKIKKIILTRCQIEFEQDTATKIAVACEGVQDEDEKKYHANLVKKNYLGHMRFIGELYKGDLVSIKIILLCIPLLLDSGGQEKVDEEKVECFTKLMTTIGARLESQSEENKAKGKVDASNRLKECWNTVEGMADDASQVSSRIRFMLQDLMEMRNNGWRTRRIEETAKTIDEIHKDIAKENARSSSGPVHKMRRGVSDEPFRKASKDVDGFMQVQKSSFGRSASEGWSSGARRSASNQNLASKFSHNAKITEEPRRNSSFAALSELSRKSTKKTRDGGSKTEKKKKSSSSKEKSQKSSEPSPKSTKPPEPPADLKIDKATRKEYKKKTRNVLKEYFVGGDVDEVVLSLVEIIGVGTDAHERATIVVEGGTLFVMEMKRADVEKFLFVLQKCLEENKISTSSCVSGLGDPFDLLSDIVIDAPLAKSHLCHIFATLVKKEHVSFNFLLDAPEGFMMSGIASKFASDVLQELGEEARKNQAYTDVVGKLEKEDEKDRLSPL